MPTNIFSTSLTSDALRAGILTIDVSDLNASLQARLAQLEGMVSELMVGLAQPVPSEGKMVDVTAYADAMVKVGEHGRTPSDANRQAVELNFPLWKFQRETGWTYDFLRLASVDDFRKAFLDTEHAYLRALEEEIRTAVFNPIRREFSDKFGKSQRTGLLARPFWNADGMSIPPAPNGATFTASSHTHYNGTSGSSVSIYDIDQLLIDNVREHGGNLGIALFIPAGFDTTLAALSTNSVPYQAVNIANTIMSDASNSSVFSDNLDADPDNKLVGTWRGNPVFTRSWVPANYMACVATGAREKGLGFRSDGGLRPLPEKDNDILTAKTWLAYFGLAANNRGAVACLQTNNQTTYSAPSGLVL